MSTIYTTTIRAKATSGTKIKATFCGSSIKLPYSHAISPEENHRLAAIEMAENLCLKGDWVGTRHGTGYIYIHMQNNTCSFTL